MGSVFWGIYLVEEGPTLTPSYQSCGQTPCSSLVKPITTLYCQKSLGNRGWKVFNENSAPSIKQSGSEPFGCKVLIWFDQHFNQHAAATPGWVAVTLITCWDSNPWSENAGKNFESSFKCLTVCFAVACYLFPAKRCDFKINTDRSLENLAFIGSCAELGTRY